VSKQFLCLLYAEVFGETGWNWIGWDLEIIDRHSLGDWSRMSEVEREHSSDEMFTRMSTFPECVLQSVGMALGEVGRRCGGFLYQSLQILTLGLDLEVLR
jgi:hypothetical protein